MTAATTSADCVAMPTPPMGIDWRVIYPSFPLGNPAAFGHVKPASQPLKRDGETQTLVQLALLLAEAKRARNLRKSKEASLIERDLRALRRKILAGGK